MKKLIAFAGSNSSTSINRRLVKYTLEKFQDFEIQLLDLNDFEMPIYSIDRERNEGIPQLANDFRKIMHESDGIICSLAEHNWNLSVALKNILDWCSRIDINIFDGKPVLLMSTSGGRVGGARALEKGVELFPKFKGNVIETFSLPSFNHSFVDGEIIDEELRKEHFEKVEIFRNLIK